MSNQILTEVNCPNCLSPIDVRVHGQHITCSACSSQFILLGHLCSSCGSYHAELSGICTSCGAPLSRICRKCHTANWAGDEFCAGCGTAMDILDFIVQSQAEAQDQRQSEKLAQIRQIRDASESASSERMATMMAAEAERQAALRQRQTARKRDDRRLILAGAGLALLIGLCLLLLLLL